MYGPEPPSWGPVRQYPVSGSTYDCISMSAALMEKTVPLIWTPRDGTLALQGANAAPSSSM